MSKHLGVLKLAGRRDGRETRYSARPQALAPETNYQGASFGWQRFIGGLERVVAGFG